MEEKQHMDLKVRLDYHSIGMSEFVRACSEASLLVTQLWNNLWTL